MTDICLCGIAREDCDYHKPQLPIYLIPVHDVSGAKFVPGITNFTLENLFDASANLVEIKEILVHPAVYNRLNKNNLLDSYLDGSTRLQGIIVNPDPTCVKHRNVFDTTIIALNDEKVILRTREA